MFVDLVGSTALSAQLDPEDMREIVGAPITGQLLPSRSTKGQGVRRQVSWATGCWPYFGYPQAHRKRMTPSAPSWPGLRWSRRCRC